MVLEVKVFDDLLYDGNSILMNDLIIIKYTELVHFLYVHIQFLLEVRQLNDSSHSVFLTFIAQKGVRA